MPTILKKKKKDKTQLRKMDSRWEKPQFWKPIQWVQMAEVKSILELVQGLSWGSHGIVARELTAHNQYLPGLGNSGSQGICPVTQEEAKLTQMPYASSTRTQARDDQGPSPTAHYPSEGKRDEWAMNSKGAHVTT